jgi:uncharacterized membrane protein YtjA (UPF0391 family)
MFALSIAFLALALIAGMFALLGAAGGTAVVAAVVAAILAVISMIAYWQRRPASGAVVD